MSLIRDFGARHWCRQKSTRQWILWKNVLIGESQYATEGSLNARAVGPWIQLWMPASTYCPRASALATAGLFVVMRVSCIARLEFQPTAPTLSWGGDRGPRCDRVRIGAGLSSYQAWNCAMKSQ